jgi:putrescine transport system substrate-binding protein
MTKILIRWFAFCLLALSPAGAWAQERVVNVYNWTDYIDPYAIARFERETGIHVHYDVYDSLETLEAKLLAGHSGYDVVVPTSEPSFSRLIRDGALHPLDRSRIPNLANLDPALMQRVASSDPGNRFGAIYLWGTIGLGLIPSRLPAGCRPIAGTCC